jgi:hypothetical protein
VQVMSIVALLDLVRAFGQLCLRRC